MSIKQLYTWITSFLFEKDPLVVKIEGIGSGDIFSETLSKSAKTSHIASKDVKAIFSYRNPLVKTLIWNIKFRRNKIFVRIASELFYTELSKRYSSEISDQKPIIIIPMPISKKRRRQRGYNQMEIIADGIKKLDIENKFEIRNDLITRKHTPPQSSLHRKDRLVNMKDVFKIEKVKSISDIPNRTIIIIDDVITTGTTTNELKNILLEVGIKNIEIIALAH